MRKTVHIGGIPVGDGHPTFMVAEIGINHNGNVKIAKDLIDAAQKAGCQAVKFQKRTIPVVYSEAELAKPRELTPGLVGLAIGRGVLSEAAVARLMRSKLQETTNGDLKWALEFTRDEYAEINRYCAEKKILWFASPWDEGSVDFLEDFDPPCYKVASASLTDDALLRHIRSKGRPVILSTGMSTIKQVDHAIEVLGHDNLIVLYSVSTYPTDPKDLNLKTVVTMRQRYPNLPIGYSGHEKGIEPSVYAVAYGASMVERHITLTRVMWGSDQAASLEPAEFEAMIKTIRELASISGDGEKRLLEAEIPIMKKLRRKG